MLIKDPYLGSDIKHRSFSTVQPKNMGEFNQKQNKPNLAYLSQPYNKPQKKDTISGIQSYQRQMRNLSEAYRNQQQALRKITGLHCVKKQYNEAIKQRNYELNTRLTDLTYEKSLLAKRHEQQILHNTYDKDLILTKYQQQNEQIIRLKRSNAELLQQKVRLQEEIDHLMFLMQKDSTQGSLEIKQQLIRMENMERTLRGLIHTKDAEIMQLRHRLKLYQDQNRRLGDLNKTLTITRQQVTKQHDKLDNLSNISHLDSNIKSNNKENIDTLNRRDDKLTLRDDYLISELNQQKEINKQLLIQITLMKKKLFEEPQIQTISSNMRQKNRKQQMSGSKSVEDKLEKHNKIREKTNQKIYQLYCKSIKEGQKQKKNSLLIFIENYKKSTINQSISQINNYMELRESLKSIYKTGTDVQMKSRIQMQLPMKLNSRQHSQDSEWVLSTMQFTKNQKSQAEAKNQGEQSNNAILFLFRLLTIQFRTKNPLEGKKFFLDPDVQNELLHAIVKATQSLIQIS